MIDPHPCDDGCLYAREVGTPGYSCARGCSWDQREPELAAIDGVEPITYVPRAAYFREALGEPHGPFV